MPKYTDFRAAATAVAPLPQCPTTFGLDNLPTGANFGPLGYWGNMYNAGANAVLDCTPAAMIHTIMYMTWTAQGTMAPFLDIDARNLYSTLTGYVPGEPSTDTGMVLTVGLDYWQNTGIVDRNGVNHKISQQISLKTGDAAELAEACYLLGPIGVGVNLSTVWQNAFAGNQIWDTVKSPTIVCAHYFPVIGRSTNGNFICLTFGGLIQMTPAGFEQFTGGSVAFTTQDYINPTTGKSPLGYTMAQLDQYSRSAADAFSGDSRGAANKAYPSTRSVRGAGPAAVR